MKQTLLEMVQSILSDMDSEDVNSISDTIEARQIASVIEDTYYNIIVARDIPEHDKLLAFVPLSDTSRPTHFLYPERLKAVKRVDYNVSDTSTKDYREIQWVPPEVFLDRMDENDLRVETIGEGVDIFIGTSDAPRYYTSFDDQHVIFNSFNSSIEQSMQSSKTRVFGSTYPVFTISDSFIPDMDLNLLPMLLAEAKSTCFSLFKGGSDPKVEQSARRLKSYVQNDMHKSLRPHGRPNYGRN